jgi:hypothetical protein
MAFSTPFAEKRGFRRTPFFDADRKMLALPWARYSPMNLSREELIDFALRYISQGEVADFPFDGDLYCILERDLTPDKILKDDEGWRFGGYNICKGYTLDDEAKPAGKWVWLKFVSLSAFPPTESFLKLQPPHVVKGVFQDPSRSHEYRLVKIDLGHPAASLDEKKSEPSSPAGPANNIIKFPTKRVPKKSPDREFPPEPA